MKTIRGAIGLVLALAGGPCIAGEPRTVEPSPKFGTSNDATYTVSAFDFSPIDSTTDYVHVVDENDFTLSTSTPYGAFYASPDLPAGALLKTMSVYACTTPDNPRWVQRKSNGVARFHRSSYAIGLALEQTSRTFSERYNLPDADYAAHGGSFPIHVTGTGIIGCVTVSGLPQREDHNLVI